eukprot:TRINITY_DN13802_c0_g1_i1.p1 TRINITY_DN13802_c0_g1~~TRINITY_DN13802_c0_g1_i1.p1  ORF type:complete len:132 (-),score=35.11 TRINITY_DN13802_c0_g1_i1:136-531(-)
MGFKFLKFLKGDGRLDDVMKMPCTALWNWEDILYEISSSNIVQRDNIAFAKKLNKDIAKVAKEKYNEAKDNDHLWSRKARRKLLLHILKEWVKVNSKKTTVKKLMTALSLPEFFDVKLRVEKLLLKNCRAA